jgi:ATP/maltotriose-dependent transcriptional regulator MalT
METWKEFLAAGQSGLSNADWSSAKAQFEESLRYKDSPEAHDGLGIALWWLNDVSASHHHRTVAYNSYKQKGDLPQAAIIASWLAREQVFMHGNAVAMNGWFARAGRLQRQIGPCIESAWCDILKASMMEPPEGLERVARETINAARSYDDENLEAFALAFSGLAGVVRGRVEDGMAQLDEAMTMATSGEVVDFMTISEVFCVLLSACEAAGDLVRGEQWCRVAAEYAERHNCPFLSAYCRTTYGSLLTALGRWKEAEIALTKAIKAFEAGHRGLRVHALFKLADLRICQGKLGEAQVLLTGLEDQGAALVPLARLHLAKGEEEMARAVLAQALESTADPSLYRIPLLDLLAEVMLALDDVEAAWQVAEEQETLAKKTRSDFLVAQAALTKGRIRLHAGEADAVDYFSTSIQLLKRYEQSLLAGQARFEMANALQDSDPAGAAAWAKAALATFERIGATRKVSETAGLLRELGVATHPGPRTSALLTQRETEILGLVAQGLTNPEIGQRLYISPKTVEHHVSRILSKLNVRNRAEAAAYALVEDPSILSTTSDQKK